MTSTYLGYKLYANDLTKSLQRVAAEPQNAKGQTYFEANIGKVKSVDDFVNNYRLFTYAMKAYGLQDLGNAKALMKKVLESNLSDPRSIANSLNDARYTAFAKAFNFTASGAITTSGQAQTNAQQQDTISRSNLPASSTAALRATLSQLTSVSSLESNSSLYSQVLSAYGLNATTTSKSDVTMALESNLSDPLSFANRKGEEKLRTLAQDFNFGANGATGSQKMLQSSQNIAATQTAYMSTVKSDTKSQAAATEESSYYAQKLPELTSVDQLVSDKRLVTYVETAFNLDPHLTTSQLRSVLTSDLLDAKSAANTLGVDPKNPNNPTNYQRVASAFNIGTDGTAWDHSLVQPTANLTAMTKAYAATIGSSKDAVTAGNIETDYFNSTVPTLKSVDSLLADSRLVAYVKAAFNLPKATAADLGNILRSNLLDPRSAANTMGANARQLATDFNFAPDGFVYSQRPIENASNLAATTTAYQNQAGTSAGAKAAAQTETDYFTTTISRIKSVDDLLSDKRLVAYVTKAYNLPTTLNSTLRQVLTSNLLDPKSTANTLGGGYQTLAAAFDISPDGSIAHPVDQQAQSKTGLAATHIAFLNQTMETEAGASNEGVRLALYFKRVAPTITSAYGILADKALTKVVQTMLGLSASVSNADIDSQAKNINARIKVADFKDPQKLDKLVAQFAALYDIQNGSSDTSSMIATLFSTSASG